MNTYFIKFFPTKNAFLIFPTPKYDNAPANEGDKETFKWNFKDNDTLFINWESGENQVENPYLEFLPHRNGNEKATHRHFPFEVSPDAGRVEVDSPPKENSQQEKHKFHINKKPLQLTIRVNNNGARWSFNFGCEINKKNYTVDPEMRIGTNPR